MDGDVSLAQALTSALVALAVVYGLERFARLEGRPRSVRFAVQTAALFAALVALNAVWPAGL